MTHPLENVLMDLSIEEARPDPFRWFATLDQVSRPRQLVKGILPAASLAVVFGESGSGKTFMVSDLALHIAAAVRWRDRKVNGGLVVYVAAEAAGSVGDRVAAWRRVNPLIADAHFAVLPRAVNLLERPDVDGLIIDVQEAAQRCGAAPALVVFDTLARCIAGADENSAADVGAAVAACDRIRVATGATVLLVHHSGKDIARGARGSSALRAAVDVEISIEGLSGTRIATITKSRDSETGLKMAFDLEPVQLGMDEDGDAISSLIVRSVENGPVVPQAKGKQQTKLMVELEQRQEQADDRLVWPLIELRQIARSLDMHKNSARDAVHGLHQHGVLVATIGGSYLATYEPQDRTGRKGPKRPNSSRTTGDERDGNPIRVPSFVPSLPQSNGIP